MGNYDPALVDSLAYGDPDRQPPGSERRIFEAWFHAACYLPLTEYRFRLPRMRRVRHTKHKRTRAWLDDPETPRLLKQVLKRIELEGALRARDFEDPREERGLWWDWKPAKRALEYLFSRGDLMIANRVRFERVYDLAERVRPDWVELSEPSPEQAALHVLERSARALGICTANQVADYSHDYGRNDARPFITELLENGILQAVMVETHSGEVQEMVVHQDHLATLEAAAEGSLTAQRTTFLSPFDSFFYPKGRDEQLWGFRQVLEAYKPAEQREWGYYCLPILHQDRLIGRFDPRLDRKESRLHIEALYLEPGVDLDESLIVAVATAMRDFMAFHQVDDVVIERSSPDRLGKFLEARL